jgi:hypothetical protein
MRENVIESYLVKKVKEAGGRAYKFVSPGNAGVPDRLVLLPGGKIAFVELKAPGRKPTVLQTVQQKRISDLGFRVYVIDNKKTVDQFIGLKENEIRDTSVGGTLYKCKTCGLLTSDIFKSCPSCGVDRKDGD